MGVGITVAAGAVLVFFAVIGKLMRGSYLSGFAEGFSEARARFERIIKSVRDRKFRAALLEELQRSDSERERSK
jgi:hypothetical protein